ncbi:PREDICTED: protein FAR1-RELATED SEQUENCE 4-like [Nicotiana attenuata]|uniref:protein FAR1-RELATED SEQUENCE 4-like n=1 Tax=Nicotiana attenuata TaxID=49451 RepID=UPI000904756F|nr:PREDICTED: protein FAR1-RELATED SEQUENCE 4-like [Nicotiana attenuata]
MEIRNDGVRVYMETKKENKNLGSYPLCITVRDFNMEFSITNENTVAGSSGIINLIDIPTSPVIEEYESIIITDSTPSSIEVGQVYQDKETIATAMKHYSVMHKFQFRVKRSSSRSKLPSYLYNLEKTYPGSVVKLKKTDDDCFLYVFVAICASISCWEYCSPVEVVDGTFLKSAYRGIMLTASTMDAAGTILPLSYAVVDSENDTSWKWFFEQFKLAYGERPNMCVVSDQNESILKATSIVYPSMPYYSCMWHIWTNIWAKFKKGHLKLSELYFATTRSYTLDEFNERMSKIEEIDPRVKAYLYDIGYHRWSRVHATVNRTWTMTSNIAESLNAVRASTDYIHTVLDGVRRYIIYLENKKCSCGQFQLDELPCPHALAALRHRDESFEQYCSPCYTRANLLRTYEIPVNPLPDKSKWNVPQHITEEVVNPPKGGKRQPGRPQKERYKTYDEINSKKYKVSCDNCGGEGHNKRSCKNAPKKK